MHSIALLICLQLSEALVAAFGRDSEGGRWTVGYLVDKVVANLEAWTAEAQLVDDSLQLLVALCEKRERWELTIKTLCMVYV